MMKYAVEKIRNLDVSGKLLFNFCFLISAALFVVLLLVQSSGVQKEVVFQCGKDFLADFLNSVRHVAGSQPYVDGHIQPPLGFLLLMPFKHFADFSCELEVLLKNPKAIFSAVFFVAISECWLFFMLKKFLKKLNGFPELIWLFISGVNIFSMERGTVVIFSAGCIAGFLAWYDSPEKKERLLSYFLLSVAFALKIYPVLFGILLLKRRDWQGVLFCMLSGLLLTFPLFLFFDGGFNNIHILMHNLQKYRNEYSFTLWDLRIMHIFTPGAISVEHKAVYMILRRCVDAMIIFCNIASFFSRRDEKLIFSIACLMILCPVGAGYYTMLYLAVPFLQVYNYKKCRNFVTLCWVLLLTPLRFEFHFNDLLCPLLLHTLLLYGLYEQIKNQDFIWLKMTDSEPAECKAQSDV